jgi:hypothetical protein
VLRVSIFVVFVCVVCFCGRRMHLRSRLIDEVMNAANSALVTAMNAEQTVLQLCDLRSFDGFRAPDDLTGWGRHSS